MADEFFNAEEKAEEKAPEQEVEKVKVGEEEYSQEELDRLVNLGKMATEAEERFNTKIDRVYPEFTKASQRVKELESKLQEAETASPPATVATGEADIKAQALKQAKELGIITVEDINTYIDQRLGAERLKDHVQDIISTAEKEGRPVPSETDLLTYMGDNGINNPEAAYKLMYEKELDSWKEKKLQTIKPKGFESQESSTAGVQRQVETKIAGNLDELRSQLRSYMKKAEGSENS